MYNVMNITKITWCEFVFKNLYFITAIDIFCIIMVLYIYIVTL